MGWEIILALSIYEDRKEEYVRTEIMGRKKELDALAGRYVLCTGFGETILIFEQFIIVDEPSWIDTGFHSADRITALVIGEIG